MANARALSEKLSFPGKTERLPLLRWELFPHLLVVMILLTGVSLFHVWSRTQVIESSLRINEAGRLLKEYQQENGRLTLEVASLKSPARIEGLAKGELGMALPTEQQVVLVK